ncbi:class III extradiol ring-cleavage dioxygenase family protein [Nocardioides pakistanensis]
MIVAAVVCPHPPLLLRELCGAEDAVPDLRAACASALARALRDRPDAVVVVGGAEETRAWDPSLSPGVRRFGTTAAADTAVLPQSLGIGRRLLEEAGWDGPVRMHAVSWSATPAELADTARALGSPRPEERMVLLVLADGSARRGEKAPGHLDERAFGFDDEVACALAEGDAKALAGIDAELAQELMAAGRAALGVLGEAALQQGDTPRVDVLHRDDPFGVDYVVALWELA